MFRSNGRFSKFEWTRPRGIWVQMKTLIMVAGKVTVAASSVRPRLIRHCKRRRTSSGRIGPQNLRTMIYSLPYIVGIPSIVSDCLIPGKRIVVPCPLSLLDLKWFCSGHPGNNRMKAIARSFAHQPHTSRSIPDSNDIQALSRATGDLSVGQWLTVQRLSLQRVLWKNCNQACPLATLKLAVNRSNSTLLRRFSPGLPDHSGRPCERSELARRSPYGPKIADSQLSRLRRGQLKRGRNKRLNSVRAIIRNHQRDANLPLEIILSTRGIQPMAHDATQPEITQKASAGAQNRLSYFFLARFPIRQRWPSDYNPPEKGVPLTLVPKPPPTASDVLRKQLNRVVDKPQGQEPKKATALFEQLVVQGQILLRQGSKSATDSLPSVAQDTASQPSWSLPRDTDLGFCVLCDGPATPSDRCCAQIRRHKHSNCVCAQAMKKRVKCFKRINAGKTDCQRKRQNGLKRFEEFIPRDPRFSMWGIYNSTFRKGGRKNKENDKVGKKPNDGPWIRTANTPPATSKFIPLAHEVPGIVDANLY
ncbi:hypothetical protein CLF_101862 [Clonorchis sinensis]|uniref:Uncharacterized protein n=1 Tax=Clonorchis sinensis TaxID=79923 RepID=G7Y6Q7_CLOSI|nr:hypothetical protein CLF_101862 [Clonorchis sinensis]